MTKLRHQSHLYDLRHLIGKLSILSILPSYAFPIGSTSSHDRAAKAAIAPPDSSTDSLFVSCAGYRERLQGP